MLGTCSRRDYTRLHANLSRVNAIDHLLSTTVALVIAFAPRLNRVCTTCTTRGDPCTKFLNSSKLFPRPHRVQNCPRVCALVIRDCYAFYSLAISVLQRLLGVCHFFPAIQSRSTRGGLCDRAFNVLLLSIYCFRGRVVKAMYLKSIGLCPHRFKSCGCVLILLSTKNSH